MSKPNAIHSSYVIEWDELEIISQVGAGAFAEVYEALRAGERVAVKKMLTQTLDDKNKKEFEDEVILMGAFHSSYIVGLYGACFKPPNLCMIMEFLPGGSLNHVLYDSGTEISWDKRWQYARDTALGMYYLHSRNPPILHRDLKSGNLLLTEGGTVKITDFGLSRVKNKDRGAPKEEFQGGTDRWTAPEVIAGDEYTEAADVFSFGVILYEIASRQLPFQEVSPEDVRRLWAKGNRPSIDEDVPSEFDKLIRMCWDQNPFSRPSFKEIVSYIKRKGRVNSSGEPTTRLMDEKEKLERENEQLNTLKEVLEKRRDEADRTAEREKKRGVELEEQKDDLERRWNEEKNKRLLLERENAELQRSVRKEGEKSRGLEDELKATEKKLKIQAKKLEAETKEEQQKLLEEIEKRIGDEKVRFSKLKLQLEEMEKKAQEEEGRRVDAEKKIGNLQRDIDEEKKKKDDLNVQVAAAEKKAKQEKRKFETEKKRREDLEAEEEEAEKRRAAARKRAGI